MGNDSNRRDHPKARHGAMPIVAKQVDHDIVMGFYPFNPFVLIPAVGCLNDVVTVFLVGTELIKSSAEIALLLGHVLANLVQIASNLFLVQLFCFVTTPVFAGLHLLLEVAQTKIAVETRMVCGGIAAIPAVRSTAKIAADVQVPTVYNELHVKHACSGFAPADHVEGRTLYIVGLGHGNNVFVEPLLIHFCDYSFYVAAHFFPTDFEYLVRPLPRGGGSLQTLRKQSPWASHFSGSPGLHWAGACAFCCQGSVRHVPFQA